MRIVSLIDQEDVIERILRHLELWQEGVRVHCGTDPPGETALDQWLDDPFPDYDTEPVHGVLRHLKGPAAPKCASRTPCSTAPALRRQLFRVGARPATRKSPCLTSGPTFVTLSPWKRTLSASDSGPTPRRAKSDFLSVLVLIRYGLRGMTAAHIMRTLLAGLFMVAALLYLKGKEGGTKGH